MERRRFFMWSGVGAVLWVSAVTLLGYFLGQAFPALKDHLELAILAIVAVSVIPMVVEVLRHAPRPRTARRGDRRGRGRPRRRARLTRP